MVDNKKFFNETEQMSNRNVSYYKAVNWNQVEDPVDKVTWDKLVEQFWLDTRIPVSNDVDDYRKLTEAEKDVMNKAFVGLTLLDTLQSEESAPIMMKDAVTQHEKAVFANITFMESVA